MRPIVLLLALAACGDDAATTPPDAPIDMSPDGSIPPPAGSFTCVGQPRKGTAPDPLLIAGTVRSGAGSPINGAMVEIHRSSDGALLGSATSGGVGGMGRYGISVATGGVAPAVYRKTTATGFPDTYLYDAFPLYFAPSGPEIVHYTAAENTALYNSFGVTEDPTKAIVDIRVVDCPDANGTIRFVAGAKVSVAGAEKLVYLDAQGQPTATLTETTSVGYATVLNAPVGPLTITVVAGPYTYRTWTVTAYPGAYTIAYLSP
jgi:hypothetical protein